MAPPGPTPTPLSIANAERVGQWLDRNVGSLDDICHALGMTYAEVRHAMAVHRDHVAATDNRMIVYRPSDNLYATAKNIQEVRDYVSWNVRYLHTRTRRLVTGTIHPAARLFGRSRQTRALVRHLTGVSEDLMDVLAALGEFQPMSNNGEPLVTS